MALGDRLELTYGSKTAQEQNCRILDQMEILRNKIDSLRSQMRHIAAHGLPKEDTRTFVVEHHHEKYTEADLMSMSPVELKDLRSRVYQSMYKDQQRATDKRSAKNVQNERATRATQKAEYLKIIDRIREEQQPKGE